MKNANCRNLLLVGLSLAGLFCSTQTFADGCFDPGVADTYVTQYGGADLSCPSGYTECVITFKNGNITSKSDDCAILGITANVDPNTDGILWESDEVINPFGIDSEMTNSAQGGKGCLITHGTDKFAGTIGYATNPESDDDFFPATKAVFCSDDEREVASVVVEDPVVKNCILEEGEQKKIYGVTFSCDDVGINQERTIIVVQDTACDINGDNCQGIPAFGFTDGAGNIDFNNVCRCKGNNTTSGGLPDILACDPDPENPGGCEVSSAEVPVDISIQNPKCFTVGGRRRCY